MPPDLNHCPRTSPGRGAGARAAAIARMATAALAVAVVSIGPGGTAAAAPPAVPFDEAIPAAPKAFDGIGVREQLGAQVPLDLAFRDHTGAAVTLGDLVRGDLPVILTFNYSDCPMLCSLQLNGLVAALPQIRLMAGRQFRIVTVVIEPKEAPARAAETRSKYLERLTQLGLSDTARDAARAGGWTFLVAATEGDDASIRRLAETVGFGYKFVPERNEWAHPAALIFLSPSGTVTRYVGDVQYGPELLTQSIMSAGTSEPSASAGFILSCFHYDADVNNYSRGGMTALRYAAAGFLLLMLTAFGTWRFMRRRAGGTPGVDRS
jgi:protein SCO1/2